MPNVDRAPCSRFRQTSRKAAKGHVIEIVTNRSGLSILHERFGGASAECRKRLGPIPGHRLFLAARPLCHNLPWRLLRQKCEMPPPALPPAR